MTLQEHIDDVMDYLDFERIQFTMEHLNWRWVDAGIPDVPTIRQQVRKLMKEAYKHGYVSTGGLVVRYDSEEDSFDVSFRLDSVTTNC